MLRSKRFLLNFNIIFCVSLFELESVVYELLNIIKHSDRLDVQVELLNKTRQLDRERNLF